MPDHHPVFDKFEVLSSETVPVDCHWGFLGEVQRKHYDTEVAVVLGLTPIEYVPGQLRYGNLPPLDEEYHEWIDVLEAVIAAQDSFTMIELGAGFGKWIGRAGLAARLYHDQMPLKLIGVEAEPTHFQWLQQHLTDNGFGPESYELIEAAVDAEDGEVVFQVGDPGANYGQSIVREGSAVESVKRVRAVSLNRILSQLDQVDLIDLDIQGEEYRVLSSAINALNTKVKRIHIGTHGEQIERDLRALFRMHGWYKLNDYACQKTQMTEWGEVVFGDGVQTWINPRLSSIEPTATELNRLQWMMSELEKQEQQQWLDVQRLKQEQLVSLPQPPVSGLEQHLHDRITVLENRIAAMESSKFWKIRTAWMKLKSALGGKAD